MRIRVVTLNVWALPWRVSRDNAARMHAIGDALAGEAADVFAFQEVWTAEAREALIAAGGRLGYPGVWHNPATGGGSGLLVLSRFPIERARFTAFRARGLPQRIQHADYYGGKGFVLLELATPEGPLSLLTTHLHARYVRDSQSDEYRGHRTAQVVQLCAALGSVSQPLVALGDFNLREQDPEYQVLVGLSGLRDSAVELDSRQATIQAGSAYQAAGAVANERIDYVFTRDGEQRGLRSVAARRIFDRDFEIEGRRGAYSDHAGLLVEVESAAPRSPARLRPEDVELARRSLERGAVEARERRSTQRIEAALAWGGAGLSVSTTRLEDVSRRRVLRRWMLAGAGMLAAGGAGLLLMSELFVPDELEAFQFASEQLDRMARAAG